MKVCYRIGAKASCYFSENLLLKMNWLPNFNILFPLVSRISDISYSVWNSLLVSQRLGSTWMKDCFVENVKDVK